MWKTFLFISFQILCQILSANERRENESVNLKRVYNDVHIFGVRICWKQHVLFEFLNFPEGSFHEHCRRGGDKGWLCSQLVCRFYCERLRRRSWGRFYSFARVTYTLVTSISNIFPKAHGADKLSADFLFLWTWIKSFNDQFMFLTLA